MSEIATEPEAADRAGARGLYLLVTMPALNEAKTVADVVAAVPRQLPGFARVDVLVVNDGSTDATAERAEQAGAIVVHHPSPRGCGAAFHTALAFAMKRPVDVLVTLDADGQFDPADIPKIVEPVVAGRADFVTASRFKDPALTPDMPWIKKWGNRRMSALISRIAKRRFHDVSCGMRCYSREAAMHLNLLGAFTYTQEVFLNLSFKQLRIEEVPVRVLAQREHGRSRVASSIFRYALSTLRIILRCYRDYRPMGFFGRISLLLGLPGVGLETFLLVHYVRTQTFSPHLWAGFLGGGLIFLAVLTFLIGMIGGMLNRHRIYLEELLYEKRRTAEPPAAEVGEGRQDAGARE